MRVGKLKNLLPMKILDDDDIRPESLLKHMHYMLQHKSAVETPSIDMNGAANAAEILKQWANESNFFS